MRHARAFTLIELVMTVAIIALLTSIALPLAEIASRRTAEQQLRVALRDIRTALDAYKQAADEGRIALPPGASGYPRKLEDLVDGVTDARAPRGEKIYFLRRLPRDPLAPADTPSAWGKRSYRSPPAAPEEGDDVFDIYSLAAGVGLNGVPYRAW